MADYGLQWKETGVPGYQATRCAGCTLIRKDDRINVTRMLPKLAPLIRKLVVRGLPSELRGELSGNATSREHLTVHQPVEVRGVYMGMALFSCYMAIINARWEGVVHRRAHRCIASEGLAEYLPLWRSMTVREELTSCEELLIQLENMEGGQSNVATEHGMVDYLSESSVYIISPSTCWYGGLGRLCALRKTYPDKKGVLIVDSEHSAAASAATASLPIVVWSPDEKGQLPVRALGSRIPTAALSGYILTIHRYPGNGVPVRGTSSKLYTHIASVNKASALQQSEVNLRKRHPDLKTLARWTGLGEDACDVWDSFTEHNLLLVASGRLFNLRRDVTDEEVLDMLDQYMSEKQIARCEV